MLVLLCHFSIRTGHQELLILCYILSSLELPARRSVSSKRNDRIFKRFIIVEFQKVVIMRKNLILISLFIVLLSSCGLQVSSLLFNEEYRKVINVLNRDTAGLRVPDDVPFLYKAELGKYDSDILAEYYYYRAYTGLKKYKKAIEHIVKYLEKTGDRAWQTVL